MLHALGIMRPCVVTIAPSSKREEEYYHSAGKMVLWVLVFKKWRTNVNEKGKAKNCEVHLALDRNKKIMESDSSVNHATYAFGIRAPVWHTSVDDA
jgi:hypothetical protein